MAFEPSDYNSYWVWDLGAPLSFLLFSSTPLAGHPLVIPVTMRAHMLKATIRVGEPAIIPLKTWASLPSFPLIAI